MRWISIRIEKNDDAQLLLMASVIMAVSIIVLAAITASLSNIGVLPAKSSSIPSEFSVLREKFGIALQEAMGSNFEEMVEDDLVDDYFDHVKNIFSFIEGRHNNYFNAELKNILYTNDRADGLNVCLTLNNEDESIYEEVDYYI
jgi:hypothetical protein